MSALTQGTQIYFLHAGQVHEIEDVINFNPGSSPADQIDVTPLSERKAKKYRKGLQSPSQGSGTINADPQNVTHLLLKELADADDNDDLQFAIGWSDGFEVPPTAANGASVLTLPETRTWFTFRGYIADFPFDFQGNTVVATALSIQRSGAGEWKKRVAP
ncbi:phage tail tube protein [Stenotrophomonas sp. NPDC078853]|uniref:phage tail tube protein n=1 Tax=Stenotrophomonas sp. NPDC078853 TaxID=3364534 RepID=UPI00384D4B08